MINVCTNCLRLNPLHNDQCHYCHSGCQNLSTKELGMFIISQRKKKKELKDEEDAFEKVLSYPELWIFEESRQLEDCHEQIYARP